MTASRNIVVIGGGPAGTFAAIEAKRRDPQAAHADPHPLGKSDRPGQMGVGQQDHEFVASISGQPIATAHALAKG